MFNKLERIHRTPNAAILRKLKPMFEFSNKKKDGGLTREQKLEIKAVNKYYKNKLNRQSSFYSLGQWNKDFQQSLNFKKNICEYPTIDFHKTNKFKGLEVFKNIKKEYNNSLVNNNMGNFFDRAKFKKIDFFIKMEKGRKDENKANDNEKNE